MTVARAIDTDVCHVFDVFMFLFLHVRYLVKKIVIKITPWMILLMQRVASVSFIFLFLVFFLIKQNHFHYATNK